jgi:hypothetical protein
MPTIPLNVILPNVVAPLKASVTQSGQDYLLNLAAVKIFNYRQLLIIIFEVNLKVVTKWLF